MDRHRSRHSMAFSTPQSQRFTSSQSRRSVSALDADSTCALETLFETLMNDPTKRDVVMKLLMQDKRKLEEIKHKQGNRKKGLENSSSLMKVKQKFACESPTALMRRKALEKRNEEDPWSSTRAVTPSPVPFECLLQGVIAYVEVISNNCDRSGGAKSLLRAMGAIVKDTFTRDVTHVVFKDGSFNVYQKAKLMKTHLVSVLWLEAIRRNHARVPEKNYPALGTDMFKANLTLLCEEMQKDYEDVVRDELSRTVAANGQDNSSTSSKNSTSTNAQSSNNLTEDVIDVSQDCDVFSITSKASRRLSTTEAVPTTPDSLKLHSSPISTSDSDSSGVGVVNGHAVKKVVSNLLELKDDSKSVDNIQKSSVDKTNSKESAENVSSESTSLLTVVKKKSRKSLFNHIDEEDGLVLSPVENVQETRATLHLNADGDRQELINRQGGVQNSAEVMEITGRVNHEFVTKRKTRSISKVRELLNPFGEKSTRNKDGTILEEQRPTMRGLIDGRVPVRKPGKREEDFNEETCKAATNRKNSVKRTSSTQNLATNSQVENGNAEECGSKKSVSINSEKKSTRKSSSTQELSSLRLSADSSRTRSITTASEEESKSKTEAKMKTKLSSNKARDTKTRKSDSTHELSSLRLSTDSRKTKNSSNNEAATEAENHSTRKTRRSSSSQDLSSLRLSGNTQENRISGSKDGSQHKGQKRKSSGSRSRTSGENSYQTISSDSSLMQSVDNALQALNHDISPKKGKRESLVGKSLIQSKENESDTDVESERVATRRSIRKAKAVSRAEPPQISESDDSPTKEKKKVRRLYNLNYCFDEISVPWNAKDGGSKEDAPAVFKKPAPVSKTAPILLTETALAYVEKLKAARPTSSDSDENVTEVTQKTAESSHLPKRKSGRIAKRKKDADEESTTTIGITPQKNRRSTLDFVPKVVKTTGKLKGTQSNKKEKKSSVVCTRFHRPDVQVFQQVVKKLGKFFVEDEVTERTSHLVVGESKRTINMLRGIARGCWILKSEWLYKSLEAREWLPEEDYEVTEFSPAVQQCRQQQQAFGPLYSMDIFENCGPIYVARSSVPRCSDLQELVRLCKGEVTQMQRNALIVVGEFVRNDGVTCVVEKWILDSIMFNKRKAFKNYLITGK